MHSSRRSCSLESLQVEGYDEIDGTSIFNRPKWIDGATEIGFQDTTTMESQPDNKDEKVRRFVRKSSKKYSNSWRGRQPKCLQEKHKYFTVSQGNISNVTNAVKEYEAKYLSNADVDESKQEIEFLQAFNGLLESKEKVRRRKSLKSFIDAVNEGNTELYRRSLIERIDSELEKMKLDGFIDDCDEDLALDNKHIAIGYRKETNGEESWLYKKENLSETLCDDLETGSSFVEAYNDDGRELIIAEVIIERKAVSLNDQTSLDETIRENMRDSDLILITNDNKEYDVVEETVKNLPSLFNFDARSNRSTVYSTASESVLDDDDDVFTDTEEKHAEDKGFSSRRETYCDPKGNVRIERIESLGSTEDKASKLKRSNSITPIIMLDHIVDEIKSTERKYLSDLSKIIDVYKPAIEVNTPHTQKHDLRFLFGNIAEIREYQERFLFELGYSLDATDIVRTFIYHEVLFTKYPSYLRNKPKADRVLRTYSHIIKKIQEELDDRLDFSAYLLTPLQRLGKYILFLENIQNQFQSLGISVESTQMALDIVKREMTKGNDYVAIESIQNSPISKLDYGTFIMRENFIIIKPRKMEVMVFLFKNIIVFTNTDPKEMETFYYLDSIKTNDLRIATFDDLTLHLTDFTKSKRKGRSIKYSYVLEAKSDKIKNLWKKTIESILWQQLYIAKESIKANPATQRSNQEPEMKNDRKRRSKRG
nr:unnamed protein product [Callosobruchus chinensis]